MCFFETIRWATRKADAFLMKDRSARTEPSPAFVISSICPSSKKRLPSLWPNGSFQRSTLIIYKCVLTLTMRF